MAGNLTAKDHIKLIQNAQARLILRIQFICNEAVFAIGSDDPRAIERHLEKLRMHSLTWDGENEQFFSAITYALEQLGLKPAT